MAVRITFLGSRCFFVAAFSQAPGPVSRTVLIPLLKSGIPAEVLIPAKKGIDYWEAQS